MVVQYKEKNSGSWKDYHSRDDLDGPTEDYDFRLLSGDKKKVLGKKGSYSDVMKRRRQVEYFKRNK